VVGLELDVVGGLGDVVRRALLVGVLVVALVVALLARGDRDRHDRRAVGERRGDAEAGGEGADRQEDR